MICFSKLFRGSAAAFSLAVLAPMRLSCRSKPMPPPACDAKEFGEVAINERIKLIAEACQCSLLSLDWYLDINSPEHSQETLQSTVVFASDSTKTQTPFYLLSINARTPRISPDATPTLARHHDPMIDLLRKGASCLDARIESLPPRALPE